MSDFEAKYPDMVLLYSDFERENGKPKPMTNDPAYPWRLEIVSEHTGYMVVTMVALYGPTPKSIFGGKTHKAIERYIEGERPPYYWVQGHQPDG